MAKKSAETSAKKPKTKKAPQVAAPEEQAGSVNGTETTAEALGAAPGTAGETPAAAPNETAAPPETFEEALAAEAETQAAPAEERPVETASLGRPAVVRAPKGLNLRAGPALSYEVLEVLPDGEPVTALELPMGAEVPGWRLVYTGGRPGWTQSRFLRLEG